MLVLCTVGDVLELPSAEDLEKKRYTVQWEEDTACKNFLQLLRARLPAEVTVSNNNNAFGRAGGVISLRGKLGNSIVDITGTVTHCGSDIQSPASGVLL